ncbi:MAG: DNA replication complex subunit Gins51 [Candidatus Ranarchaeia archaeon]
MYQVIQQLWKNELEEETLIPVKDTFWRDTQKYIEKLRLNLDKASPDSLQAGLVQLELQKTKFMVKDLLLRRRMKLVKLLSEGKPETDNLSSLESKISKGAVKTFLDLEQFLDASLKGEEFTPEEQETPKKRQKSRKTTTSEPQYLFVRFKTDLPQIIGVDSKTYGPFKKEDVATLPKENALPLIKRDAVQEIE